MAKSRPSGVMAWHREHWALHSPGSIWGYDFPKAKWEREWSQSASELWGKHIECTHWNALISNPTPPIRRPQPICEHLDQSEGVIWTLRASRKKNVQSFFFFFNRRGGEEQVSPKSWIQVAVQMYTGVISILERENYPMGACVSPFKGHFYLNNCIGLTHHSRIIFRALGLLSEKRGLCNVKLEFVKQETHLVEKVTWAEKPQQIPTPDNTKLKHLLHIGETTCLEASSPLPNLKKPGLHSKTMNEVFIGHALHPTL